MATDWLLYVSFKTLSVILWIPWIVVIILSAVGVKRDAFGRWGKEFLFVSFGCTLFAWQFVLYLWQILLSAERANPFTGETFYGYPSEPGFYVAAFLTFVFEYTFLWNIVMPWFWWVVVIVVLFGPGAALVYFQVNSISEIMISQGWGVFVTTVYFVVILFILPDLPYILNCAPFTWLACVDTVLQNKVGIEETERIRRLRVDMENIHKDVWWTQF